MNSPQAPNPMTSMLMANALNNQQAQANTSAAQQTQKMNMVNQSTPYGALTYEADPNAPGGYRAVQSFSAPLQGILNTNEGNTQNISNDVGTFLNNNAQGMTTPLDLSYGANAQRIAQINSQTLDPQWQHNQTQFDQNEEIGRAHV